MLILDSKGVEVDPLIPVSNKKLYVLKVRMIRMFI